jgi:hypothetical protein
MGIFEKYSDLEYTLYESIVFAMLGLIDTVNTDRSDIFAGFLDDLYFDERGSDVSGEPGWTIERLVLTEQLDGKFLYIQGRDRDDLESLFLSGEREVFWVENINSARKHGVLSTSSFWLVVSKSFEEYVKKHPEKVKELELVKKKYWQISRGNV